MWYLLSQIFMCLLGTAILFFALGWFLRNRFKGRLSADDLVTETERSSWQTSLDILKARLETETSRKVEAEKALQDLRTRQTDASTLVDQHANEIRTLSQQLADNSKALGQRDDSLVKLQSRITELESQKSSSADLLAERDGLKTQIAALSAQAGVRDQSLRAANEDLAKQKSHAADLEKRLNDSNANLAKLQAADEDNKKLKAQISESAPKLAAAVAAATELLALRARVADLEPKLKAVSADSAKQLSDRDAAVQAAANENKQLKDRIAQLQAQAAKLEAADAEIGNLRGQIAELQPKLNAAIDENAQLKTRVSELTPKLAMAAAAGAEMVALKAHVAQLEPQVAKLQSSDAELANLRERLSDLQNKLHAANEEANKLKAHDSELTKKLSVMQTSAGDTTRHLADLDSRNKLFSDENAKLKAELADREAMLKTRADESDALKTQLADLTPKLAKALAGEAEAAKLRTRLGELDTHLAEETKKQKAHSEESHHLKGQLADVTAKLTAATAVAAELTHLKSDIAELQAKLSNASAHETELITLRGRFSQLEPQLADREAKLRTSHDELANFKRRWVEHEGTFHSINEENVRLKGLLAEYEPKLRQAQQQDGELTKLRIRIGELEPQLKDRDAKLHSYGDDNQNLRLRIEKLQPELESLQQEVKSLRVQLSSLQPQIHDWETRYTTTVAQKDEELSQCRSRVAELDLKLSQQHVAAPAPAAVHHHAPGKTERDDLKKIFGIGPVLEKRLNALGVYFYRDIAGWTKEDILHYEEHMKEFRDRIERDHWVEGAREEHFKKYGERLLKTHAAKA